MLIHTAGSDIEGKNITRVIPAGQLYVIVQVPIVNDDIPEDRNENFVIDLKLDSGPAELMTGRNETTVIIVDDDGTCRKPI